MTNQEAIANLKTLCHTCKIFPQCAYKKPECFKTIEMAISALQAQDAPDTNVGDMISRQKAIDALKGLPTWWADEGGYYGGAQPPMVALLHPEDAVSAIENLLSAQPESNCLGCKHAGMWENEVEYGYPSPCTRCKRRANDYYGQ